MEQNKIKSNFFKLGEILEKGLPVGDLTVLCGESKPHNTFVRILPIALEKCYSISFNLEQSEVITKHGQCIIDEMIKKMEKEGLDTSKIQRVTTVSEKIGDTWFPVTYYPDGSVIIDYPSRLLKTKGE